MSCFRYKYATILCNFQERRTWRTASADWKKNIKHRRRDCKVWGRANKTNGINETGDSKEKMSQAATKQTVSTDTHLQ